MGIRVHVLAKELKLSSQELLAKLKQLKVKVKGHMSTLDEKTAQIVKEELKAKVKPVQPAKAAKPPKPVQPAKAAKLPKPIQPAIAAKLPKPIQPAKAAKPPKPIQPAKAVKPPKPIQPATAARPLKPAKSPKPVKPAKPVEPVLAPPPKVEVAEKKLTNLPLKIPLTVKELAVKLSTKPSELIKQLMKLKILATINQLLDEETVQKIIKEFGFVLERLPNLEEELLAAHQQKDRPEELTLRSPVVTLMGHVDHGKTSLLDLIRKTKVAAREAGGITQHIGAYVVKVKDKRITFLDTPGHEAFTAMRARGANATDIVVLVVAADDGIMPQTIEAIDHAQAAGVPIVVAINKCDLANINIAKVKTQLSQHNFLPEDMGGKTITVNVSAKTGQGIDELLEMLLLEAEMLELKANAKRPAKGVVIESKLSRGTGPTATVLVQNGILATGDILICGDYYGRVKSMINDRGEPVKEAGPSEPVEISGLSGVPEAGEPFFVVQDEKKTRDFSLRRLEEKRLKGTTSLTHISLEQLYQQVKEGKLKELKIIVKADVQGSLEALLSSLQKLSSPDVSIKVIHSGGGNVNVSDIMLASASNAVVIGFHVGTESGVRALAEKEKVDIRLYEIIYEALADIKSALEGMLEPQIKEVFIGKAQVRQIFKVSKVGNVAGCIVLAGKMVRNAHCRIVRNNEEVFKGKLASLKKFKEDVQEVTVGNECGISVANFTQIRPADIIECFEIQKIARRL